MYEYTVSSTDGREQCRGRRPHSHLQKLPLLAAVHGAGYGYGSDPFLFLQLAWRWIRVYLRVIRTRARFGRRSMTRLSAVKSNSAGTWGLCRRPKKQFVRRSQYFVPSATASRHALLHLTSARTAVPPACWCTVIDFDWNCLLWRSLKLIMTI